ncbi:MAG TPA: hypothetical protein VGI11_05610, partial [Variovorax sp.]
MNSIRTLRRWSGPPLALQITALLLGGLVVAQLVTLALTMLLPAQPPPQYQLDDIAKVLGGASGAADNGRALQRVVRSGPPEPSGPGWLTSERSRHDLAQLLGRDESEVRLYFYTPLPFAGTAGAPPRGLSGAADPGPRMRMAQRVDAGFIQVQFHPGEAGPGAGAGGPGPGAFGAPGGFQPGGLQAGGLSLGGPMNNGSGAGFGSPGSHLPGSMSLPASGGSLLAPESTRPSGPIAGATPPIELGGISNNFAPRNASERAQQSVAGTTPGSLGTGLSAAPSASPSPALSALPSLAAPSTHAAASGFTLPANAALAASGQGPGGRSLVLGAPGPSSPSSGPVRHPAVPAAWGESSAVVPLREAPMPAELNRNPAAPAATTAASPAPLATPGAASSPAIVALRAAPQEVASPVVAPARGWFGLAPVPFVVGDFIAAVRLPQGGWATVQPVPE